MANVVKLPIPKDPSKMDCLIDHLFQVLPADDHEEISRKLTKRAGRKIDAAYVSTLLSYLRKNSHKYGWTVPHSSRGAKGKNKKGKRFFHVLVERGRDPQFDVHHEQNLQDGVASTISGVATQMRNQADALNMSVNYFKGPAAKQMARHMSRQQKRLAEDAELLLQMISDEHGSAA
jgi:hypothetical protein